MRNVFHQTFCHWASAVNVTEPWNAVFLVGFLVYMGIRHVFSKRVEGQEKAVSQVDWLEKALLATVMLSSLLLPVLYLFTSALAFADYELPTAVRWVGLAAMAAALWLFWRSHSDLGQNWSVSLELREAHELISHGVYRFVRHPMYSAIWLWGIAQGLVLGNWLAGWSAVVGFALMYFMRTPREERMMCERFGDEYRQYMEGTGRVVPRILGRKKKHSK